MSNPEGRLKKCENPFDFGVEWLTKATKKLSQLREMVEFNLTRLLQEQSLAAGDL